jgi:hypothetical protein
MTRFALPAAVLLAAIAAWLSQGTLAYATAAGPRIALVPVSLPALLAVMVAALAVVGVRRAGLPLAPIALLVLTILPWLPLPMPTAVLAWAGPIRWLVWFAVALSIAAPVAPRVIRTIVTAATTAIAAQTPIGRRLGATPLGAGLLAFVVFAVSAWQVAPSIPGGDEPHYLVITQSLLLDRDLKIENNHRRGDYQSYFAGALPPHYVQRGRNGEIYSIHAPGLSAVVAPAFAVGGYRGVVLFLVVLAACGSALAWHLGWLATRSMPAAWFGWAATTCSATAIFHSFTVYPDGLGGVVALTGVWALFRAHDERGDLSIASADSTRLAPWFLHGAALALLPWMHSRFALLAGSLGALVLLRLALTKRPMEKAVAFLAAPALSAMAWLAFFVAIYGRPDPSAPYGSSSRDFSAAFIPGGLAGLLFDERFGLLANAPVLVFAFAGLVWMLRPRRGTVAGDSRDIADWRLALELLFVLVPYLLTATSYAMWWAGWSAPARFANPAVFALAIPAAVFWQRATTAGHRSTVVVAGGALALTVFVSVVLVSVDGGRLAYNTRETTGLLLDWAAPLIALGEGMPVWYRGRELVFVRDLAIWILALAAGYAGARAMANWPTLRDRGRYATAVVALFAAAGMAAMTIVWRAHGIDGIVAVPSQLALLRRVAAEPRAVVVQLGPPRVLDRATVLSTLDISSEVPVARPGAGRSDQPLMSLPSLPAGRYRVRPRLRGPGGWLMIGVGPDQFSLWSAPLPTSGTPIDVELPVNVRALIVRGDEEARRSVAAISVEPVALTPPSAQLTTQVARRAVKYPGATVYFLDEGCFPEPDAFWIGGARQGTLAVQPAGTGRAISLLVRNAPVENTVTVTSGQWREELKLMPGEERQVQVPLGPGRTAALVTAASASGFRPSELDPKSRDARFLGAWVKIQE